MSDRIKKIVGDELYSKLEEVLTSQNVKIKDIDIVKDNYVPKSRFDEVNTSLKANTEKITHFENQNLSLEKLLKEVNSENVGDLIGKYTGLKESLTNELSKKDLEISNIKKTTAIKEALTSSGSRHTDLLMKSIDLDSIKFDNDKLIGISDVIKDLKTNYKDLFVEKVVDGKTPKSTDTKSEPLIDSDNIFSKLLNGTQY